MADSLIAAQIKSFADNGFLVVENVLNEADIQDITDEYAVLLDEVAGEMYAVGKLSSDYRTLPFAERYIAVINEDSSAFERLEISLPLNNEGISPDDTVHTGPAVFRLLTHPRLLDVVESIIGPEIYSAPAQHVRLKPPRQMVPTDKAGNSYIGNTVWHQDHAFVVDEALETQTLTVWVAITEATIENGCLLSIPGSHKKNGGSVTIHCPSKSVMAEHYIPGPLMDTGKAVPLPVGAGGVILLHRYNEHTAYPNRSRSIRWSFDLRYQPSHQPSGRPAFPGFVVRSQAHPERVLTDPQAWTALWQAAKARLVNGEYDGVIYQDRAVGNEMLPICA